METAEAVSFQYLSRPDRKQLFLNVTQQNAGKQTAGNDAVIVGASRTHGNEGTLAFGFTAGGFGMKTTLFSRVQPGVSKTPASGGTFSELTKPAARTQGSTNNLPTENARSVQPPSVNSPANRTLAGAGRSTRSPFRDAMQKGILSGAGMLTQ